MAIFTLIVILVHTIILPLVDSNVNIMAIQSLDLTFDVKDFEQSNIHNHNKTVVCVLDLSPNKGIGEGIFQFDNIDGSLCTQLVLRIGRIDKSTLQLQIKYNADFHDLMTVLNQKYPHLTVFLSVGGYEEGSFSFTKIAADHDKSSVFAHSAMNLVQEFGFHGIDIAWEFPGFVNRGGHSKDKDNLPKFLGTLKDVLGHECQLSLTAAGDTILAGPAYNLIEIVKVVDQINLRTFDFAGSWTKKTAHHAPLTDKSPNQSVSKTVSYYLKNGIPPEKLVLGIPFYGRTFVLKDDDHDDESGGLGKTSIGGFAGSWINNTQLIGYHELCHELSKRGPYDWQTFLDNFCLVPFAKNDNRWVTFDNPESVMHKVNYAINNKLQGVMAWTIDTDDFKGTACRKSQDDDIRSPLVTYPLLRTINKVLVGDNWKTHTQTTMHSADNRDNHKSNTADRQNMKGKEKMKNVATQHGNSSGYVILVVAVYSYSVLNTF